jgi:WhiB family redox-sensing transcriptional regulator
MSEARATPPAEAGLKTGLAVSNGVLGWLELPDHSPFPEVIPDLAATRLRELYDVPADGGVDPAELLARAAEDIGEIRDPQARINVRLYAAGFEGLAVLAPRHRRSVGQLRRRIRAGEAKFSAVSAVVESPAGAPEPAPETIEADEVLSAPAVVETSARPVVAVVRETEAATEPDRVVTTQAAGALAVANAPAEEAAPTPLSAPDIGITVVSVLVRAGAPHAAAAEEAVSEEPVAVIDESELEELPKAFVQEAEEATEKPMRADRASVPAYITGRPAIPRVPDTVEDNTPDAASAYRRPENEVVEALKPIPEGEEDDPAWAGGHIAVVPKEATYPPLRLVPEPKASPARQAQHSAGRVSNEQYSQHDVAVRLFDVLGNPEEPGWQERALCAQTDPEAFFTEKGGSTREAKRICATCEVRTKCLEDALDNDERFGIQGGLSERERRRLKRRGGYVTGTANAESDEPAVEVLLPAGERIAQLVSMLDDDPEVPIDEIVTTLQTDHARGEKFITEVVAWYKAETPGLTHAVQDRLGEYFMGVEAHEMHTSKTMWRLRKQVKDFAGFAGGEHEDMPDPLGHFLDRSRPRDISELREAR